MVSRVAKGFSPNRLHQGLTNRKRLSGNLRPRLSAARDGVTTSKMKVVIRIRPQSERELEGNQRNIVETLSSEMLMFDPKEDRDAFFFHGRRQEQRDLNRRKNKELKFNFDRVFDHQSTNEQVFEETMRSILKSLIDGYNCSVFAYGATGAGKTFTMLGDPPATYGITYLTMIELYRLMASLEDTRKFEVRVSYLEVYNETVCDLLAPKVGAKEELKLRETGALGVFITGLNIKEIKSAEELLELLRQGNMNRTQHPTDANAESSRSHAVFQVHIRMVDKMTRCAKLVKLSMIDLAGSERAAATGCRGKRFVEGANINKSLLSLGNCINALADGLKHVPYRDSKLTRLLKDSLGGNCNTVMIANVSPSVHSLEDTYNTLKYAARAKKIKTKLSRNIVNMDPIVAQYAPIVEALQLEVAQLKAALNEAQEANAAANQSGVRLTAEKQQQLQLCLQDLRSCYEEKSSLHAEVMKFDGLLKCVNYRKLVKIDSGHRLKNLCFHDEAALKHALRRIFRTITTLNGQVAKYNAELQTRLALLANNAKRMDVLQKQIADWGLEEHVKADEAGHLHKLSELECDKVVMHLLRLAVSQHSQLDAQDKVLVEMAKTLGSYHAILDGQDMMTNPMDENFTKIARMLEGIKVVTWGQTHKTTLKMDEPVGDEAAAALEIPPKITDFMALKFSKYQPQPAGSASNISQLNYSREGPLANSSRYSVDLESGEKFIQDLIGNVVVSGGEENLVFDNRQHCDSSKTKKYDSGDHVPMFFNRDLDSSSKANPVEHVPIKPAQRDTKYAQECHPKKYESMDLSSDVVRNIIDSTATLTPDARKKLNWTMLDESYVNATPMVMAAAGSNVKGLDKVREVASVVKCNETYVSEAQMAMAVAAACRDLEGLDKAGVVEDTDLRVPKSNETYASEAQMAMVMVAADGNLEAFDKVGEITVQDAKSTVPSSPNSMNIFVNGAATTSNDLENYSDCEVIEIVEPSVEETAQSSPDLNATYVSNTRLPETSALNDVANQGQQICVPDLNATYVSNTRLPETSALNDVANQGQKTCVDDLNATYVSNARLPETSDLNDVANQGKKICVEDLNATYVTNARLPERSAVNNVANQGQKICGANLNDMLVLKKRVEIPVALDLKKALKGTFDVKKCSPVVRPALDGVKSLKGTSDLKRTSPVDRADIKKLCNKENVVGLVPSATAPLLFLKPTLCVPKAPKLKTGKPEPRTPGPSNRIPLKTNNQPRATPGSARKIVTNGRTASVTTTQRPHGQHPYTRPLGLPTPQKPKKI